MLSFHYDSEGKLVEIGYSEAGGAETEYVVERNALGDVSALYTTGGVLVGPYSYDPYGRLLEAKTAEGYNDEYGILIKNPFRYRGYYYDSESGWYYLNSRYYDPNTKRFINADDPSYLGAGDEINSYNLFAYCGGDPVNQRDERGKSTVSIMFSGDVVALLGISGGIGFSFDDNSNMAIQYSYAVPSVDDTVYLGVLFADIGLSLQMTVADSVEELNGHSSALGGGAGLGSSISADIISLGKLSDDNAKIDGVGISAGPGVGMDLHLGDYMTKTIWEINMIGDQ